MAMTLKESSYAAMQGQGKRKNIEMPPEGYVLGGPEMAMQPTIQQPMSPFGEVPDQLPEDTVQAMQEMDSEQEVEQIEETQPIEEIVVQSKPTPQDSFKAVREAKERAERERDLLMAQMIEMQSRAKQPEKVEQPLEPEFNEQDFDIDEDALVEGKYVKKVVNEIKSLKKQLETFKNQTSQISVEAKIKAHFPDFEDVVSKENVEILNAEYPEIAQSLKDTKDIYAKAKAAYTVMKKFGIGQIDQEQIMKQKEKIKAVANVQKPRPLASINPQQGDSPLSKANAFANGLTKDLQAQLLKEMMDAKKRM